MHRRTFLAALAAIPGLRWLKPEPTYQDKLQAAIDMLPATGGVIDLHNVGDRPISAASTQIEANRFGWMPNTRLPAPVEMRLGRHP